MTQPKVGFLYAGLPGAGKSTIAELAHEHTGGTVIETGDIVRRLAEESGIKDPSSTDLGNFAARGRAEHGGGYVGEKLVGMMLRDEIDVEYPLHVVGVRHVNEVVELREYLTTSWLILVKAPFETRLSRLQSRGREGEDSFDAVNLLRRDERELIELGTATIIDFDKVDVSVNNHMDNMPWLRQKVKGVMNGRANVAMTEV